MVLKVTALIFLLKVAFICNSIGIHRVRFDFYSVNIEVKYDSTIYIKDLMKLSEETISSFKLNIEKSNYVFLLRGLLRYKDSLMLNDWLYYKLIERSVDEIYRNETQSKKNLIIAFLLYKSNYDIVLGYYGNSISTNILSKEYPAKAKFIFSGGKKYTDLIYLSDPAKTLRGQAYVSLIFNNPKAKLFSFDFSNISKLKIVNYINKEIQFFNKGKPYNITIKVNKSIIDVMKEYPRMEYEQYFNVGLSSQSYSSLIPQIKNLIKGKGQLEGIRFLLSFVRTYSKFSKDSTFYNDKVMIAEEALFYNYGDCEDRSILFYNLVKEIYNLPMIVLEYPNHMNVAVKVSNNEGLEILEYKLNKYCVCETNDTTDTYDIGEDEDSNVRSYKVIKEYIPKK